MPAKKSADRFWGTKELERLEELVVAGKTALQIAAILGRSFGSVRGMKVRLGVIKPRSFDTWEPVLLLKHDADLAVELNLNEKTVRTRRSKLRRLGYDCPDRRYRGNRIDVAQAEG